MMKITTFILSTTLFASCALFGYEVEEPETTQVGRALTLNKETAEEVLDMLSLTVEENDTTKLFFYKLSETDQSPDNQMPKSATGDLSFIVMDTYQKVNDFREKNGKEDMGLNPYMCELAQQHSENMAKHVVPFGHAGFFDRFYAMIKEIPGIRRVGENVAMCSHCYSTDPAATALYLWKNSPCHKANMLGDYNLTGVGVAQSGKGSYYFTQLFCKTR